MQKRPLNKGRRQGRPGHWMRTSFAIGRPVTDSAPIPDDILADEKPPAVPPDPKPQDPPPPPPQPTPPKQPAPRPKRAAVPQKPGRK